VFANGGRERIEQMPDPDVTKDPPSIDGSSG
jgi:hypothetical protein